MSQAFSCPELEFLENFLMCNIQMLATSVQGGPGVQGYYVPGSPFPQESVHKLYAQEVISPCAHSLGGDGGKLLDGFCELLELENTRNGSTCHLRHPVTVE